MNKNNIPLWIAGGLLAVSVLATATFYCTYLGNITPLPFLLLPMFLVYVYPLCASVFAVQKGLKAGIIAGAAAGIADYLLLAIGYPLSRVIRGHYFSFFNACKDAETGIIPAFSIYWQARLNYYLALIPAVVIFYVLFSVLKRKTFFCAGRLGQYLGSALLSLATLAVYDVISICRNGGLVRQYGNVISGGIFVLAFITGTVLFSCFAKFNPKIKKIPTDEANCK